MPARVGTRALLVVVAAAWLLAAVGAQDAGAAAAAEPAVAAGDAVALPLPQQQEQEPEASVATAEALPVPEAAVPTAGVTAAVGPVPEPAAVAPLPLPDPAAMAPLPLPEPAAAAVATAAAAAVPVVAVDVLVIGAGVAGLKAAADLTAAGVVGAVSRRALNVTVVEAGGRVLGRVATQPAAGGWPIPIELGAQWLHGTTNNVLTTVASSLGLPLTSTGNGNDWVVWDGPTKVATTTSDAWWALFDSFDPSYLSTFRTSKGAAASNWTLGSAIDAYMNAKAMSTATRKGFLSTIESSYVQEYAASTDRLNLATFDADAGASGPDAVLRGGYASLFAPTLAAAKDVRLNTTVTSIAWTARAGAERLQVNATKADGSRVTFAPRYVICTLPLGVLQARLSTLFPGPVGTPTGLTAAKVTAINSLGMGLLNKVVMHFSSAFWAAATAAGTNQWIDRLATTTGQPNEFYSLYQATGQPVLVAFFAGTPAVSNEAANDTTTLANVMTSLRQMFGTATPNPLRFKVTRWASDPLFYGSYSYVRVGAAANARSQLAIAEANNTLVFAGEATRTDFPSTVNGAWLSGIAAAKAVLAKA